MRLIFTMLIACVVLSACENDTEATLSPSLTGWESNGFASHEDYWNALPASPMAGKFSGARGGDGTKGSPFYFRWDPTPNYKDDCPVCPCSYDTEPESESGPGR